jgi:hypothetical protein
VEFSSHCCFYKLSRSWLLGSAAAPAGWCVCLQLTWEVGHPPSPVEFSSLCHSYKLSHSWLLGVCRRFCLLQACLFTVPGRIPLPHSVALRAPCPLCYMSLLFLLLITQFLFFSLGGDRSVQGAMLIWPTVVCENTACHLAHLVVCIFPSHLGTGVWWWPWGPPGFSI